MCSHPSSGKKLNTGEASPPNSRYCNRKSGTTNWRQTASLHAGSRLSLRVSIHLFRSHLLPRHQSVKSALHIQHIHQSTNQAINQAIDQSSNESIKLGNQSTSHLYIAVILTIHVPHRPLARLQGRLRVCVSQHARHRLSILPVGP